jgi:hypothetical protein
MSAIGRTNATAVQHQWQRDTLATATTNSVIEGDIATHDAVAVTELLYNQSQIADKVIVVSGTADAVSKAGRRTELGYLLAKKSRELKRDMEVDLSGANGYVVGGATTARTFASLETWYQTNYGAIGAGAAAASTNGQPDAKATVTAGTTRALTESLLKDGIRDAWTQGGDPTLVIVGGFNKVAISGFTGGSTRTDRGEDKRLTAAVDVYISDFGTVKIVASRFSRAITCHIIDPALWAVAYLRTFRQHRLAKTGDSERRQMLVEFTLVSREERGNAIVADLSTS